MRATVSEPPTDEHPRASSGLEFAVLAEAVRRHRVVADHPSEPKRPADHALYRALDELEREGSSEAGTPQASRAPW